MMRRLSSSSQTLQRPVDGAQARADGASVARESGAGGNRHLGASSSEPNTYTDCDRETRKLDPERRDVFLAASTPGASYVAVGAGAVWVSAEGGIARLDPASGDVAATIAIEEVIDLAAAGDGIWVTDKVGGKVLRVDPTTNAVVAEIATGAGTHDLAIDEHGIWVTNYQANSVSRIDPATNEVVGTIEVHLGQRSRVSPESIGGNVPRTANDPRDRIRRSVGGLECLDLWPNESSRCEN